MTNQPKAVRSFMLSGDQANAAAARFIAVLQGGGTEEQAELWAGVGVYLPDPDDDEDCPF